LSEIEYRHYACPVCGKRVIVDVSGDPDYGFYQKKNIGNAVYVRDYVYCSQEHMQKHLKQTKTK